MIKSTVAWHNF